LSLFPLIQLGPLLIQLKQFKKPVDVGDLMHLRSCVLHTEGVSFAC